jgi:hypothetical protein
MTPSLHSIAFSDWRVDGRDFITLAVIENRHFLLRRISCAFGTKRTSSRQQCPLSGVKGRYPKSTPYGAGNQTSEFFALVGGAVVAWPHDFIFTNVKEN